MNRYCFAQYEDESYGFWAEGKAGWFELKTATPGYRHLFNGMSEATDMFYHMSDTWKNVKKTTRPVNSATIIRKEASEIFSEVGSTDRVNNTALTPRSISKAEDVSLMMTMMYEKDFMSIASSSYGACFRSRMVSHGIKHQCFNITGYFSR